MVSFLIVASLCGLALLLVSWPPPRPSWLRRLVANVGGGNRSALKPLLAQQNAGVLMDVTFTGQGAGTPLNAEGDPNGIWLTITRQNVGKYTIKTVDPWLAIAAFGGDIATATVANHWIVNFGIPSQNADNTWSVTVQVFSAAGGAAPALADVALNDILSVQFLFRNSLLTP